MNPIAVTLLTGFLGAGKTTLLRHILNEQHGYKIAVIENEFGEVSVDDQLIGDRATQIKTLTNGCICCSRSNELEDALLDLLDNLDKGNIQFDRLVIECTGMADPGPIIQTFFSHEILCQRYLLDGVIALVDAVHADEQMNQFTIAQSQVGYADRILLTKTDVAGEAEKLRERLEQAEAERTRAREALRGHAAQLSQYNQVLASLKSSYDTKKELLNDLQRELQDIGVRADSGAEERARIRRDELHAQLSNNRSRRNQLEKALTFCEAEMDNLTRKLRKLERDYFEMREQVVTAKAGWCAVMRMVKDNGVERRLHRRELAYLSADDLRSMSDKALGALRLAVADNEHLRDVLRMSEDPKRPERKIQFFVAVYQHLRERIRQDIIRTDDPVEAIEQMEIELSRLTEELTSREQKLAISSRSVANIIRKTIQREQNRIRMLNQGLQNVSFGQVNSVRLNVNVRETHAMLLDVLSEQHEQHQDLFNSNRLTFSEALAKLYQRLNPQIDMGQRTTQTIGEELLDYRNYLEMEVEVNRGSDGWLRAESGALSTGEAIGTGMSILVMVVQSWEDESRRLRGKDISPCRLLFLDEAARLDARSIATLFELCERLQMQLIIAAPENISPEKEYRTRSCRRPARICAAAP